MTHFTIWGESNNAKKETPKSFFFRSLYYFFENQLPKLVKRLDDLLKLEPC